MKRFIRLACLTGVLLGAISTVQGQSRQIKLGDNLGDHMAAKDLDMNSKQILNAEGIAIGSATITNQNVAFQIDGTNKAILMPRITALTAIASPVNGMLVYNSADNKFYVRENGAWVSFATVTDLNNKTSNITVDNISIIKDNTGALSANVNSAIWNANRLQGNAVSATVPLTGQVLGWNGTTWLPTVVTSATAQSVTNETQPNITSVGTLTRLAVTAPIVGSITGNAATATKLATPRTINGVAFDGSSNISISAAASAGTLTGTTLNSAVVNSSLKSVGTLANLTVTNPVVGSVTGSAATVTAPAQPNITSVGTLTDLTVTNPIAGNVAGNAGTATKLAASKNINGVAFDGSADITISAAADANTLTGTTLNPAIVNSSLTSVGTLSGLTVTAPITGSVTGTATTATNLAAGSGGTIPYQSAAGTTAMLANGTAGQVLQSNGTTLAPSWVNAGTGDMTLAGVQSITGAKTFGAAGNVGKLIIAGSTSGTTILNANATAGSGTVVLPTTGTLATLDGTETLTNKTLTSPTLTTPALGTPSALVGTNITGTAAGLNIGGNAATATTATSATSATTATNLAAGLGGQIPYQSTAGTTAMLANGTAGQVLQSNGTTLAPSWITASAGDMTLAGTQSVTGAKTFGAAGNVGKLIIAGSTSGTTILNANATAGSGT
ncbi:hypothetical protein, partial [Daejeonella sp.]|uniref:beta strand repeat-containing protein n=1 Tax=Daejeonella sp. TaxID=2805397 RepID=UPI0027302E2C